ncbi:MAG: hypothetical protein R2806_22270 [Saprospiraceae bacterium]
MKSILKIAGAIALTFLLMLNSQISNAETCALDGYSEWDPDIQKWIVFCPVQVYSNAICFLECDEQ